MKSAFYKSYGSPNVIEIIEMEKPLPRPNEVLVQIKA